MAHSGHRGPRPLAAFCAIALACAAPQALALALGDAEVRSALGENLDLRIPVTIGKGESIEPSCFTLAHDPGSAVPRLSAARVSLERSAQGTFLRIRSDSYVNEPALTITVLAACPGQFSEYRRDYSLLVDPRAPGRDAAVPRVASADATQSAARATVAPTAIASIPSAVATLIARIGDTLESIANAIFPRNAAAKRSYIEALRESNPPLAALGDRDPIPIDTPIALPDLRSFSRGHAGAETRVAQAPARPAPAPAPSASTEAPETSTPPAPRPPRERATRPAPQQSAPPQPKAATSVAPREERMAAAKAPAPVRRQPTPGFILKLSSAEVDLTPSRSIDDRMRNQLRDRAMVLDADDQVAAVLALRNSVRQLESRVAELQLKLAGMPSSFPAPKPAETAKAPPPVTAAKVEPVPAKPEAVIAKPEPVAAKPEPIVVAPAPPPVVAAAQPPIASEPAAPAPVATPEQKAEPAPPAATAAAPSQPAESRPRQRLPKDALPGEIDWVYYGLWALALLLVLAAAALAWRLARRNRDEETYYEEGDTIAAEPDDRIVVADEFSGEPVFADEPHAVAEAARRELDSDVELSTRLPDSNSDDLRRRYIEERFPEIGKGAIVLEDPVSVVKGARLFYEDGALARAVELLQYAIERNPPEVKSWLALFEIFRLERLTGEFAELARRFREHHGKSEYWRKVQYFGREVDPGNELYAQPAINTFETIGPSQAKRLAAEASFDPVAENWLGMPMDFQNEVLANELRKTLMGEAAINEQDLVPNPMPALRNVEMFSVA